MPEEISSSPNPTCEEKLFYKPYEVIDIFVRLVDHNWNFYFSPEENIFLEIKMIDKFYRKPLRLVKIKNAYYYHLEIEAFNHLGIFSFILRHERLGYLYKKETKNVVFKIYEDDRDRRSLFLIESLPYLLIVLAVFISALLVVLTGVKNDVSTKLGNKKEVSGKKRVNSKRKKKERIKKL